MLFLGAGASKAVGIDDLENLTRRIKQRLGEQGYGDLIKHIVNVLEDANLDHRFFNEGEIDIEVIFSVLNGLLSPRKALEELGPYAIYINQLGGNPQQPYSNISKQEVNQIRSIVGQVITDSCINFDARRATGYYHDLFEFEKETFKRDRTRLFSHIVTTNYDLVVEQCAQENPDIPSDTGFEIDSRTNEYYLPVQKFLLGEANYYRSIKYLKLHGSINWWIRKRDKKIMRRNEPQPSTSLMGESYKEQLMIYPIYEKYVSQDPYFSLYYYFRKLLYFHEEYVVIGYSFRDPSINNAFADALRDRRNSRLIIVNSKPNNIEKRINDNFPQEQVEIVETPFGDNDLYSELRQLLVEQRAN
jgi:hypothetical protein